MSNESTSKSTQIASTGLDPQHQNDPPSCEHCTVPVIPLWIEMDGCPMGTPDIRCRMPDNAPTRICTVIWEQLRVQAMNTGTGVLPVIEGNSEGGKGEWYSRVKTAVDTWNSVNAATVQTVHHILPGREDLRCMMTLKYQEPQDDDFATGVETPPQMDRLVLFLSKESDPPVSVHKSYWRLKAFPTPTPAESTGASGSTGRPVLCTPIHRESDSAAASYWAAMSLQLDRTWKTVRPSVQSKAMELVNEWSRNPDGTPGSLDRVASTAGFVITVLTSEAEELACVSPCALTEVDNSQENGGVDSGVANPAVSEDETPSSERTRTTRPTFCATLAL